MCSHLWLQLSSLYTSPVLNSYIDYYFWNWILLDRFWMFHLFQSHLNVSSQYIQDLDDTSKIYHLILRTCVFFWIRCFSMAFISSDLTNTIKLGKVQMIKCPAVPSPQGKAKSCDTNKMTKWNMTDVKSWSA